MSKKRFAGNGDDRCFVASGGYGHRSFTDRLLQLEDSVAYDSTVDLDVGTIGTDSECTSAQIVCVLTATNSEVRACVGGAAVNRFVDGSGGTSGRSGQSDSCTRQRACRSTVLGQSELHRNNPAPNTKDTCSICINRLLDLRPVSQLDNHKRAE
jgi:hypothetical protein